MEHNAPFGGNFDRREVVRMFFEQFLEDVQEGETAPNFSGDSGGGRADEPEG